MIVPSLRATYFIKRFRNNVLVKEMFMVHTYFPWQMDWYIMQDNSQ